jgi:hypothetical protein
MKYQNKIYLLLSLLFVFNSSQATAQEESINYFHRLNGGLRMSLFRSIPLGDNILGSGHKPQGLGVDFSLVIPITPYGFGFGMGYQTVSFSAVDPQFLGDINRSVVNLYYLQGHFQQVYGEDYILEVTLGGGPHRIMATDGNITGQKGNALKLGFNAKHRFTKNFEVLAGIQYVRGYFSVETPAAYSSYFNRTQQLQLHLGFTLF